MLLDTGEVFTVEEDLGFDDEAAIRVQEPFGRLLRREEVRPAGRTRQRHDLARSILLPDSPPPPLPDNCVQLTDAGAFADELHPE